MIDRIRAARSRYRRGLLYPAATLTLGAAAVHFSVAPDHLPEFPPFGVFFLAVGAVTRLIAPCLGSKESDPGVLAVDEAGQFVIPLLSGHK